MSKVEPGDKPVDGLKVQAQRVAKDPSYEFKLHPRNSWGPISRLVDVCFVDRNYCGIMSNLLSWKEKNLDDNNLVKTQGQVRAAIAKNLDPPCLLNYFIVKGGLLFRWLSWNEANQANVKDNIKTSQQHIALISALTFNVTTGFLRAGDSGGSSVVAGEQIYIYCFVLACLGALCSTVLAVMFLIQMNELVDNVDAKIYSDRMGFLLQVPIVSLTLSGIFTFAGIGYWIAQNFDTWTPTIWMIGTAAPLLFPLFILPYTFGVQTLWVVSAAANEVKSPPEPTGIKRPLLLNNNDLEERFKEYVEITDGGMEMCHPDGFMEYLHLVRDDQGNTYCIPLAYVTEERAKLFFKNELSKFLEQTQDAPAKKTKRIPLNVKGGRLAGRMSGGASAPVGMARSATQVQPKPSAAVQPAPSKATAADVDQIA